MDTPKPEPTVALWKCKECGYLTLDVKIFVRHKRTHPNSGNRQINYKDIQIRAEVTAPVTDVNADGDIQATNASAPLLVDVQEQCSNELPSGSILVTLQESVQDHVTKFVAVQQNDCAFAAVRPNAKKDVKIKTEIVTAAQTQGQELILQHDVVNTRGISSNDSLISFSPVPKNEPLHKSELPIQQTPMSQNVNTQRSTLSALPTATSIIEKVSKAQASNRGQMLSQLNSTMNSAEVADTIEPTPQAEPRKRWEDQRDAGQHLCTNGVPPFESAQVKGKRSSCQQLVGSCTTGGPHNCTNRSVDFCLHTIAHEKKFQHNCVDSSGLCETPVSSPQHFCATNTNQYFSPALKRFRKIGISKKRNHHHHQAVAVPPVKIRCNSKLTFKCQFCPKQFPAPSTLEDHQNSHTRPFECHLCSQRFTRDRAMVKHKVKSHRLCIEEARATSIKIEILPTYSTMATSLPPLKLTKVSKVKTELTTTSSETSNPVRDQASSSRRQPDSRFQHIKNYLVNSEKFLVECENRKGVKALYDKNRASGRFFKDSHHYLALDTPCSIPFQVSKMQHGFVPKFKLVGRTAVRPSEITIQPPPPTPFIIPDHDYLAVPVSMQQPAFPEEQVQSPSPPPGPSRQPLSEDPLLPLHGPSLQPPSDDPSSPLNGTLLQPLSGDPASPEDPQFVNWEVKTKVTRLPIMVQFGKQVRFACPTCHLDFPSKTNFHRHDRTVHRPQPATCQQCGQSFNRPDNLKKHEKICKK